MFSTFDSEMPLKTLFEFVHKEIMKKSQFDEAKQSLSVVFTSSGSVNKFSAMKCCRGWNNWKAL